MANPKFVPTQLEREQASSIHNLAFVMDGEIRRAVEAGLRLPPELFPLLNSLPALQDEKTAILTIRRAGFEKLEEWLFQLQVISRDPRAPEVFSAARFLSMAMQCQWCSQTIPMCGCPDCRCR